MPDPRAVALALGGAKRSLFYDLNALCRLKVEHRINVLVPGDEDTQDPVTLRALIWAGLLHEAPDLTVEAVGGWIGVGDLGRCAEAFAEAFRRAATPITETAADPTATPAPSTGTSSPALATAS